VLGIPPLPENAKKVKLPAYSEVVVLPAVSTPEETVEAQ
jgi:hypothetical protein